MQRKTDGYAIVLVLSLVVLMGIMLVSYSALTHTELIASHNTASGTAGFYASEASLNARAERVRAKFVGFDVPAGTSPTSAQPCTGTDLGGGDFQCEVTVINGRNVTSYVQKLATQTIQIGAGEPYANLSAEETQFQVFSRALNADGNPEAISQLVFRSRLVPLFQFAVFFNKDLEFDQTASLDLAGPVYAAGNIFLDSGTVAGTALNIRGQVTTSAQLYRGRKGTNTCTGGVGVSDLGGTLRSVNCNGGSRRALTDSELVPWGGQMSQNAAVITAPDVSTLQPTPTGLYWSQADVRVVLKPYAGGTLWLPELQDVNGTTTVSAATFAALCPGAVTSSYSFLDNREAKYWMNSAYNTKRLMDVNMAALTACIKTNGAALGVPPFANNPGDRGAVYYFTVNDGAGGISQGSAANNYGVRLTNGANLTTAGAGRSNNGLTVATDQALIVQGNYNSVNKVPASLLSDSMNVLSTNWNTPTSCGLSGGQPYYWMSGSNYTFNPALAAVGDAKSAGPLQCRTGADTTINAAVLTGTDTTGFTNGQPATEGLLTGGQFSGGAHNIMRFQEDWGSNPGTALPTAAVFTYLGSLVSLNRPLHARGAFEIGGAIYQPPKRNWGFDTSFRNASNLPPLTPRFVYIKQDNFVRNFQQ